MDEMGNARWAHRLSHLADLEASFDELGEQVSFWAEALRAALRLMQMRLQEAGQHLSAARRLLAAADPAPPLDRMLAFYAYARDRALLMGSGGWVSIPTPFLQGADGRLRRILLAHRSLDAAQHIEAGDSEGASAVLLELLQTSADAYYRAYWHLGLSVCAANLTGTAAAIRHLEVAGLHACSVEHPLGRCRLAARLAVLYRHYGDEGAGASWNTSLSGLACPEATKEAFRTRSRLLFRQLQEHNRLVLV